MCERVLNAPLEMSFIVQQIYLIIHEKGHRIYMPLIPKYLKGAFFISTIKQTRHLQYHLPAKLKIITDGT